MPSRCWISTAVAGKVLLGVDVASTIRSIVGRCHPVAAASSALRAASSPSEAVVSSGAAMWRSRMPVRWAIHSSDVFDDTFEVAVLHDAAGEGRCPCRGLPT